MPEQVKPSPCCLPPADISESDFRAYLLQQLEQTLCTRIYLMQQSFPCRPKKKELQLIKSCQLLLLQALQTRDAILGRNLLVTIGREFLPHLSRQQRFAVG